ARTSPAGPSPPAGPASGASGQDAGPSRVARVLNGPAGECPAGPPARSLGAMNLAPDVPIRRLGPADLDACAALAVSRDWGPERRKWSLLLEAAEPYGIDAPDGSLAGAVVLARYGPALASAGMMLVAEKFSRQGLGGR